jgi:hypothetical protein
MPTKNQIKTKFICPTCLQVCWGKDDLILLCGVCTIPEQGKFTKLRKAIKSKTLTIQ